MKKENEAQEQEVKRCKNKKCQRPLPADYKYKYCEYCRNEQAGKAKTGLKVAASMAASAVLFVVTKGKLGGGGGKNA